MPRAGQRQWLPGELKRMRGLVETGTTPLDVIAKRFHCSRHTVVTLAGMHKWTVPYAKRSSVKAKPTGGELTRYGRRKAIRDGIAARLQEEGTFEERMVLYRCRRLKGAEFRRRVAELELLEKQRTAKAKRDTFFVLPRLR